MPVKSAQSPDGGPPSGGGTPHTPPPGSVVRQYAHRKKLLWFVLFALALGWFAKDGTTRSPDEFVLGPR
jgi:hypothetical protein